MSDTILNLRVGLWHLQIDRGFRFRISRNDYHKGRLGKDSSWVEFYS